MPDIGKNYFAFQKYDKIDNIFEENSEVSRINFGLYFGNGFIFDFGLLLELSLYLDFALFKIVKAQESEYLDKGPEANHWHDWMSVSGAPYIKFSLGYSFANLFKKKRTQEIIFY